MIISRKNTHVKYFNISTYVCWKSNDVLDRNVKPNVMNQIENDLASILYINIQGFCYNHLQSHYDTTQIRYRK